jgi:hypothetical protein
LSAQEKHWLFWQLVVMKEYSTILGERIAYYQGVQQHENG